MKRIILLFCLSMLLLGSACKKDEPEASGEFPQWLKTKIEELIPDQKMCEITEVTIIEYNGKKYYHVYCGIWSCMYCQFFDEQGNRPDWNADQWNDFEANKKEIKILPACE